MISTNKEVFSIVAIQTNDTLSLSDLKFTTLEDQELKKAKFTVKLKEALSIKNALQFNGCILSTNRNALHLR